MPKGVSLENRLYLIELALRPGNSWEAVLPANTASLKGMLSSNPHWKRKREAFMQQFGVNDALGPMQTAERELNSMLAELEELQGFIEERKNAGAEQNELDDLQQKLEAGQTGVQGKREELQTLSAELQAKREQAANAFEAMVETAASGILQQLTADGKDSLIPSDLRFKRTWGGQGRNLYIGAGSVLAALGEAAFFFTDDAGFKRRLGNRLYISPGKVSIYRYDGSGEKRLFLQKADHRRERHVPPGEPDPRMQFRRKPATINYPEVVNYPALLHFALWMTPDVNPDHIRQYFTVAGELGLYGYHAYRQGQFEVVKYHEASDDYKQDIVRRYAQRTQSEVAAEQEEVEIELAAAEETDEVEAQAL